MIEYSCIYEILTKRNHVVYNQPICNWMQLVELHVTQVVACATTFEFKMIFYHLCSYGATSFFFIL
jgi:hypothetical protein